MRYKIMIKRKNSSSSVLIQECLKPQSWVWIQQGTHLFLCKSWHIMRSNTVQALVYKTESERGKEKNIHTRHTHTRSGYLRGWLLIWPSACMYVWEQHFLNRPFCSCHMDLNGPISCLCHLLVWYSHFRHTGCVLCLWYLYRAIKRIVWTSKSEGREEKQQRCAIFDPRTGNCPYDKNHQPQKDYFCSPPPSLISACIEGDAW